MKCSIVAIGAASGGNGAIAVGTAEARVNDYLLEPFAISLLEIAYIGIVALFHYIFTLKTAFFIFPSPMSGA